ncbi:MAG: iron ABC transporter permease, partial [Gemmatimonadales bacterium]
MEVKSRWARLRAELRPRPHVSFTPWTVATAVLVALVLLPIASIVLGVFTGGSETWDHLARTVLPLYIGNSVVLVLGVGGLTLVTGVATAWLVTTCDFPGRRQFEWLLILPLAIPTYIVAYTYAEILAPGGSAQALLGPLLPTERVTGLRSALMSLGGVTVMMSLVLYPYVYLITRTSFQKQSGGILESSRILGKSPWATFVQVALPMARPAVVAGVTLVLMEVLNEYGAVAYFGVPTFTTGIFRAWFALGDGPAAIRLSACLLALVFILIMAERAQRGRARFDDSARQFRPVVPYRLTGTKAWAAFVACGVPVLLGFLVPVAQLVAWTVQVAPATLDGRFVRLTLHSFGLATAAAVLAVVVAVVIVYSVRLGPTPLLRLSSRAASLGYSVPGAVIAVGVLVPFLWLDRRLLDLLQAVGAHPGGLLITGTVAALVFAYVVRFLAVALNPTDSGFERLCGSLDETSRSLGVSPMRTLL